MISPAQKLVIELSPLPGSSARRYVTVQDFPFLIGRGFDCGLIIDDPYIAPAHLRIDWAAETGWTVHDLGGRNGLFINQADHSGHSVDIKSGDEILIGRTHMRLLAPEHAVAQALPLPRASETLSVFSKPGNALIYFFITVVAIATWVWLEVWSDDPGLTITIASISVMLAIIVWSALWAMAGRVIRHRAEFYGHVAVASTYVLASAAGYYLQSYVDFLANGGLAAQLTGYAINFGLIGLLIFTALGLASEFSANKRRLTAFLFAGGLVLGNFAVTAIEARSFHLEPDFPWTLEPYFSSFAPAQTPAEFINANEALFDSKTLKIKTSKKD